MKTSTISDELKRIYVVGKVTRYNDFETIFAHVERGGKACYTKSKGKRESESYMTNLIGGDTA